ncbi:MAG: YlbF family regulator [Eubacterium sp.]|nr:YlbF family regulator [Eubacterium sp.]
MELEKILRELGKVIQADERFTALQAAAKANDADEDLQKQMQELQLITLKYQQEAQKADEADQDRIAQLQGQYQELYNEIMQGENMKNYSAAAAEMEQMAQYISGMIGLFFDGQDPETCEIPAEDCTHDCSTCGGCH